MNGSSKRSRPSGARGIIGIELLVAALIFLACSSQADTKPRPSAESAAIEVALTASREERILIGEPDSVRASGMTLNEAEEVLTGWGAVFAEFADYPEPDTPVWVVEVLGTGVQPGPPDVVRGEECLDIRVIVVEETMEELVLFGKPTDGC
jgi:hypothetical protein